MEWKDGSVGKVLATQTLGPELVFPECAHTHTHDKLTKVSLTNN